MKILDRVILATTMAMAIVAKAQTVYVDGRNGNDAWDGSCDYASRAEGEKKGPLKTFERFRQLFNQLDELTVCVAPATYASPNPFAYWGATWTSATIVGTGTAGDPVVFDGQSSTSALVIDNSYRRLRLENLVLKNGKTSGSGAGVQIVQNVELVSLSNCTFDTCQCVSTANNVDGGALCLTQTTPVELVGCTFSKCSASRDGGALYLSKMATDQVLVNCKFLGCSAGSHGGAVQLSWPDGELTTNGVVAIDCYFDSNKASSGGALGSPIKLCTNTVFSSNYATQYGGAWFYDGYTGLHGELWPMTNLFVASVFTNNSAANGGVIYWNRNKRFEFRGCDFIANTATTLGAVMASGTKVQDYVLDACRIERNAGPGIFVSQPTASTTSQWGINVRNCIFADNDAGSSSLLKLTDATDRVENSIFQRNIGQYVYEAGGCYCTANANSNYLANCLFAYNTNRCENSAGVVSVEWRGVPPMVAYNLTFIGNVSAKAPYAVYENHTMEPNVFANMIAYGNRGLKGETGAPFVSKFLSKTRYSYFETGTASVPTGKGNVLADEPGFIAGSMVPAPGSPISRAGEYYAWMKTATDLAGRPRINDDGTVSMGCYSYNMEGFFLIIK